VSDGDAICAPSLLDRLEPLFNLALKGVQAEVEMLSLTPLRSGAVKFAAGVDQPTGRLGLLVSGGIQLRLQGVEKVTTCVALTNELAAASMTSKTG
jgi:hypothetical protein